MKSNAPKKPKLRTPLDKLRNSLHHTQRGNVFQRVKVHLLELGSEKLDIKLNTREQPDALRQFEHQLIEDFPNVFCGAHEEERLQYAKQAIVRQHFTERCRRRARKAEKENLESDEDIIDLTMLEDSDEDFQPDSSPNASQCRVSKGKSRVVTTPRARSRWTFSASTSQASSPSSFPAQKLAKTPTTSARATGSSSKDVKKGFSQVHYFLRSCSPSLTHLLSRFVDIGFKSVDILNEVACNWTRDDRLELLKKLQVPCASHCGEVSELELIALERRFQKYYLEISNSL